MDARISTFSTAPHPRTVGFTMLLGLGVSLAMLSNGAAQDERQQFVRLKSLFSERTQALETRLEASKTELLLSYSAAVEGVAKSLQDAGNLEGVVAAKQEIETAKTGALSNLSDTEKLPPALKSKREVAEQAIERLEKDAVADLRDLRTKYLSALESLKTEWTRAGKVDAALKIAAEIEKQNSFASEETSEIAQSLTDLPAGLRKGLIAWFAFDEKLGGNVTDLSPSGINGTANGTESSRDGRIGRSRYFNGVEDHIEFAGQFPDAEKFTLSVWVKTRGVVGKGGIFSDYTGVSANDLLFCLVGNQAAYIRADKSGKKLDTDVKLSEKLTEGWHHLVWVMGRDSTLYVDGTPVAKVREEGSNVGFHGAVIGYSSSGSGRAWFEGKLDEFMMWERNLDEDEIRDLWKRGE